MACEFYRFVTQLVGRRSSSFVAECGARRLKEIRSRRKADDNAHLHQRESIAAAGQQVKPWRGASGPIGYCRCLNLAPGTAGNQTSPTLPKRLRLTFERG